MPRQPRKLIARYAGVCAVCDEPTEIGSSIWHIARGTVSHELCGHDVDTSHLPTHRERLEAKAERRDEWATARAAHADTDLSRSRQISDMIPMGQPILVGHHSEGRHRRDLGRIDTLTRRGVEHHRAAEVHASKAEGLRGQLATSIYDDDPDALDRLREKLERLEAERAAINAYNKAARKGGPVDPVLVAALAPKWRTRYAEKGEVIARYATANLSGQISNARNRITRLERTP